jgi:hypothetical protein
MVCIFYHNLKVVLMQTFKRSIYWKPAHLASELRIQLAYCYSWVRQCLAEYVHVGGAGGCPKGSQQSEGGFKSPLLGQSRKTSEKQWKEEGDRHLGSKQQLYVRVVTYCFSLLRSAE